MGDRADRKAKPISREEFEYRMLVIGKMRHLARVELLEKRIGPGKAWKVLNELDELERRLDVRFRIQCVDYFAEAEYARKQRNDTAKPHDE